MDGTAAERIERFLEDHPGVPLSVAVGFSSPRGIAWLARRTRNRKVRLLIGDCRPRYFKNATREDRDEALAFLDRPDVKVWNWYRRHGETSDAHLKVWIAHDAPRPAALNGSANLSHKGLYLNEELVTGIPEAEVDQAIRRVEAIFDKAWDAKDRLRRYMGSPSSSPTRVTSSASKQAASARPPSRRMGASQPPATGRANRGGGCFRIAKECVSFVVALLLLAALVGMLGRGCTDGSEPAAPLASTPAASPTTALSTTTTVPTASAAAGNVTTTVPRPASNMVPEEAPVVLIPLVAAYVEALGTFVVTVNDLVQEINFVNETWDNRGEDSDLYSEAEASLLGIAEQARDLANRVRYQRVPPVLRGMHGEPGGPLRLANELADLADQVLAGLQIPVPNDGSERRAALQSFNETADSFKNSANRILRYIDESSRTEGQLTVGGQTTTKRALPIVELVDEAVAYVEGLTSFSKVLDDIVLAINVVNEA